MSGHVRDPDQHLHFHHMVLVLDVPRLPIPTQASLPYLWLWDHSPGREKIHRQKGSEEKGNHRFGELAVWELASTSVVQGWGAGRRGGARQGEKKRRGRI